MSPRMMTSVTIKQMRNVKYEKKPTIETKLTVYKPGGSVECC